MKQFLIFISIMLTFIGIVLGNSNFIGDITERVDKVASNESVGTSEVWDNRRNGGFNMARGLACMKY